VQANSWRATTTALLVVLPALVIAYDVIAAWRGGGAATISDVILSVSLQRPIIPFAVGVLCGHLFFSQR
jgi:hypothetical protein